MNKRGSCCIWILVIIIIIIAAIILFFAVTPLGREIWGKIESLMAVAKDTVKIKNW